MDRLESEHIFFHHDTIMMIADLESGNLLEVNRAAEKFFSRSRQKLVGTNLGQLFFSGEGTNAPLLTTDQEFQDATCRSNDGEMIPVTVHASRFEADGKTRVFLQLHESNRYQKAEEQLAYRVRYEQLITNLSTYFIRPDHREIEQAIEYPLKMIAEFLDAQVAVIILLSEDQSTLTIAHLWSSDESVYRYKNASLQTDQFPEVSNRLFRGDHIAIKDALRMVPNGSPSENILLETGIKALLLVPIVSAGIVIGGIGVAATTKAMNWPEGARSLLQVAGEMTTNVLARRRTELALRKSEEKYRKFFEEDLTADFIAGLDGSIKFCNPAFIRIFGFESEKSALAGNLNDLDGSAGKFSAALNQIKEGSVVQGREFSLRRVDGETVQVIANIREITDDQGQEQEILGYLFDITEHKKMEEQFRGAQRMEAIGRLAGGIAHDFNNLLTVINGYSDLLLNNDRITSEDRPKIEQIKRAGERAASLTGQLLAFSRKQIVQPRVIRLNSVVKDIEKMLRRLIGENIEFINILDDSLGNIEIDPGQIEQVLINLAVNARDAMPEGGKLTIETRNVFLDEQFSKTHHPLKPGSYVMLAVRDNGVGIPYEIQAHIFEPFFTTKEKGKGTGLGLSTIYGIIKQCQGYVWVESTPGRGSVFYIYFPKADKAPEEDKKPPPDFALFGGSESVLVIEDDPSVRQLTVSFLKKFGYQVHPAKNAENALELCGSNGTHIDLAVIDVIMPEMSGKVLSEKLLKIRPELKILFISGYTDAEIVHYGVLNSEIEFLQKPFDAEQLGRKIRQILDTPAKQ